MPQQKQDFVLVYILSVSFIYLFMITFFYPVKDDRGIVIVVTNIITTMIGYRYGSSRGSATKDETIAKLNEPTVAADAGMVKETKITESTS